MGVRSLSHWTAREVPEPSLLVSCFQCLLSPVTPSYMSPAGLLPPPPVTMDTPRWLTGIFRDAPPPAPPRPGRHSRLFSPSHTHPSWSEPTQNSLLAPVPSMPLALPPRPRPVGYWGFHPLLLGFAPRGEREPEKTRGSPCSEPWLPRSPPTDLGVRLCLQPRPLPLRPGRTRTDAAACLRGGGTSSPRREGSMSGSKVKAILRRLCW